MQQSHSLFFKMLSAKTRVKILKLLQTEKDLTVDDLAGQLDLSVPTVSRHLQLLRMQNLVTYDQDAQSRYYVVNEEEIGQRVADFLEDLGIAYPSP